MSHFDTLPRPPRRIVRPRRELSRFELWAWSPITAYRIGLTLSYAAGVYFGVSALIAGVPAFEIAAPPGWTPIWATLVVVASALATVGSINDRKWSRRLELAGAWTLFLTLAGYATVLLILAYADGDTARAAVGAGFVALGVQPGVRMLWLMSQLRRK